MSNSAIKSVVIAGGGTAGWIAAALLARAFNGRIAIRLVESEEIGTVGVGEATIPTILTLNQFLGIDEDEMLKASQGTFKLGIEFVDWHKKGAAYAHQFGPFGRPFGILPFYQYWLKRHLDGRAAGSLWDYSFNDHAARAGRFARLDRIPDTPLDGLVHAYQFDALLYAAYLRRRCEKEGVLRIEGRITGVNQRADGFVTSLTLASGQVVEGDLFLDCSGFRALLIEGALQAGFEDWSHWLPCDRAWAVPSEMRSGAAQARISSGAKDSHGLARLPEDKSSGLTPYTRATARDAGWQWRIPLQHRTGNGHVFSSRFMAEDKARDVLMANLGGAPQAEPRLLSFVTGRRRQAWVKNVVAIGLSSGFLEPLESTSIHLAQAGVTRLLSLFPDTGFNPDEIAEYNRITQREYESVRDFVILHYKATSRDDTPFWDHVRTMDIPDSLARKIAFFRRHGRVLAEPDDLFKEMSWVQVLLGQGIVPEAAAPVAATLSDEQIDDILTSVRAIYADAAGHLPSHEAFIARHCRAEVR